MMHEKDTECGMCKCGHMMFKRIPFYWSAVIVGSLVVLGLNLLVLLFNNGMGISMLTTGKVGMSAGVKVWMLVTSFVTLFIGGWVAGKLIRHHILKRHKGVLHGFVVWVLSTFLFLYYLAAPMGMHMMQFVNGGIPMFFLFLVGAIGASIGGYLGTGTKEDKFMK